MINRYRSPYPNFIHQLFVTPSKHLYVLKDGRLKWQDKPMEVQLEDIEQSEREHVVHFILADHTSSAFYAELGTSRSMLEAAEFLKRAWARKPDFFFHGLPEHLIVPAGVMNKYPGLQNLLSEAGVDLVPPSSGFYAGIHQVRHWEKDVAREILYFDFLQRTSCTLAELMPRLQNALKMANDRKINRPGIKLTRKQLWENVSEGRPEVRLMQ